MRVVVNLDPGRWRIKIKRLGQPSQQFVLGRTFGHLARKAFAGVAGCVFDQLGLLTALRDGYFHLAPGKSQGPRGRFHENSMIRVATLLL